jgi:hypothetical protein
MSFGSTQCARESQRLEKGLALEEGKVRHVAAVEIEGVKGQTHFALAVGRLLNLSEARQAEFVDAAELAVQIRGLGLDVREGGDRGRTLGGPVEPGSGQKLHPASIYACGRAIAPSLISCTH